MAPVDVLLLNTGYFRLVGSHNDRMPLSLCYLSAYLEEAGVSHCIFNGEYTGARSYWSWHQLYRSFDLFRLAVAGQSPVFREVAERVADYAPEVIILGCGDPLLASVGLGNPHAAVQQARALRQAGLRHIYFFGPYATLDPERWLSEGVFDGVLVEHAEGDKSSMLFANACEGALCWIPCRSTCCPSWTASSRSVNTATSSSPAWGAHGAARSV